MMERRQILAIVLMFLILAVYQIFYVERFQRKRSKGRKPPATVEVPRRTPRGRRHHPRPPGSSFLLSPRQ